MRIKCSSVYLAVNLGPGTQQALGILAPIFLNHHGHVLSTALGTGDTW